MQSQEDLDRKQWESIQAGLTKLDGKLEGGLIRGLFTQEDQRKERRLRSADV